MLPLYVRRCLYKSRLHRVERLVQYCSHGIPLVLRCPYVWTVVSYLARAAMALVVRHAELRVRPSHVVGVFARLRTRGAAYVYVVVHQGKEIDFERPVSAVLHVVITKRLEIPEFLPVVRQDELTVVSPPGHVEVGKWPKHQSSWNSHALKTCTIGARLATKAPLLPNALISLCISSLTGKCEILAVYKFRTPRVQIPDTPLRPPINTDETKILLAQGND